MRSEEISFANRQHLCIIPWFHSIFAFLLINIITIKVVFVCGYLMISSNDVIFNDFKCNLFQTSSKKLCRNVFAIFHYNAFRLGRDYFIQGLTNNNNCTKDVWHPLMHVARIISSLPAVYSHHFRWSLLAERKVSVFDGKRRKNK